MSSKRVDVWVEKAHKQTSTCPWEHTCTYEHLNTILPLFNLTHISLSRGVKKDGESPQAISLLMLPEVSFHVSRIHLGEGLPSDWLWQSCTLSATWACWSHTVWKGVNSHAVELLPTGRYNYYKNTQTHKAHAQMLHLQRICKAFIYQRNWVFKKKG